MSINTDTSESRTTNALSLHDEDSWTLDECIAKLQDIKSNLAPGEEASVEFVNDRHDEGASIMVYVTRQLTTEEIAARQAIRDENERQSALARERRQRQQYESLKVIYESKP